MTPTQFERQCQAIAQCSERLLLPAPTSGGCAWAWLPGTCMRVLICPATFQRSLLPAAQPCQNCTIEQTLQEGALYTATELRRSLTAQLAAGSDELLQPTRPIVSAAPNHSA